MKNRVNIQKYDRDKLIIKELMRREVVELKTGQTLKNGQLIKPGNDGKYEALTTAMAGTFDVYRVYSGEDIKSSEAGEKVQVLTRAIINKNIFETANEGKYTKKEVDRLILETNGIYLEEVK